MSGQEPTRITHIPTDEDIQELADWIAEDVNKRGPVPHLYKPYAAMILLGSVGIVTEPWNVPSDWVLTLAAIYQAQMMASVALAKTSVPLISPKNHGARSGRGGAGGYA